MPKDARWGLVVGAGAVILIAVLFFRKEGAGGATLPQPNLPGVGEARPPVPGVPSVPSGRVHRVADGETLTSIAVRYYGDAGRVSFLFRANRDRLMAPDRVPLGTLLVVPDVTN